jgi:UDP-glucuronate decarboxylase
MNTNHILLTGGTGFFGKALLRNWIAIESTGQSIGQVTLLSRNPKKFAAEYPELVAHHWLHLIHGDVCDYSSLPKEQSFTHVLHAATESTTGPLLTPMQRFDQIVNGTRNVLDLAVASGAYRFLLTSSGGVYGPQPPDMERIPEEYLGMPDPLNPNNAYSVAKRYAEHICLLYQDRHGIETIIARCFAFVGQDLPLNVHFAIGNFIGDALWRDEITVSGDGSPLRSYLDQQDLAHWLLKLMEQGESGQAYNVGSDQAISIAELAHLVRELLAPNKRVHILNAVNQTGWRSNYVPSIQKARNKLALGVCVSLEESIRITADAAKQFMRQSSL